MRMVRIRQRDWLWKIIQDGKIGGVFIPITLKKVQTNCLILIFLIVILDDHLTPT
jgi:hypothetical protein